ncbi:MAG: GAF domain-containing protein [Terriglobales bacterium]
MDRSFRLPDPGTRLPYGERRRAVRQRLHTPVYVSFNTPRSGAVLDLSELLDLHEDGFAVQTAIPTAVHDNSVRDHAVHDDDRLAPNRAVTLCLDLPETKKYVHGSGQVMWTDDTGRAGIRFSFLPDTSRHALKEWLFANLLVASTNHAARANQLAQQRQEARSFELVSRSSQPEPLPEHLKREPSAMGMPDSRTSDPEPVQVRPRNASLVRNAGASPVHEGASPVPAGGASPMPDQARLLSALDDVRRQVQEMLSRQSESASRAANRPRVPSEVAREVDARSIAARAADAEAVVNYESVLHFITERAAMFTGASGAALALLAGDHVICRASVGEPAPPVGSEVDISSGLSGECLRRGIVVSCRDTEADPRVDPEVCRTLGIGSFAAVPIFSDSEVVGLVEIFSPYPQSFARLEETILERLAELVPRFDDKEPGDKEIDRASFEENRNHARLAHENLAHARLDHERFDYEAIVRAAFAHETVAREAVDDRTDHSNTTDHSNNKDLKIESAAAQVRDQTAPDQLPPEQTAPDWTSAELASVIPANSSRDSEEILHEQAMPQPAMLQPSTTQRPTTQQATAQRVLTQRAASQRPAATPNAIQALVAERLSEQAREQAFTPASEASESALEHASEAALEHAPDPAAEISPDNPAERNPAEPTRTFARRFPFSHVVLLVMAIAVAAMALGYLLAPAIEQRWLRPAQSAEASSPPPAAIDRRGHALSTDELRKLADQGDPDAEWQMGILYHDGEAVPKDDALAVRWFELAAAQGYVRAQSTLGAYYWAGRGVPQDLSKAYFWSQLALAQGDEDSKSRLEGLSAQMTQAQVTAARQQAETWLRSHNQRANPKAN